MSINFNFGEHFYSGASNHLYYDLSISVAGAFLGFLFAIWISKRNERKDNNKEKQILKENNITKYYFLRERLLSVISYVKKQSEVYETFSKELLETPYDIKEFKSFADFSLQRINKLDVLDMWEAFSAIHKSNDNKLEIFRKLFNHVDFLQTKFNYSKERINNLSNTISEYQLQAGELLDKITLLISIRLKKIDTSNSQNEEFAFLSSILRDYKKIIKEPSNLFLNIKQKILTPLEKNILVNTTDIVFAENIHSKTIEAKYSLQRITYNKEYESKQLKDFKSSITEAIQSLEKISEQMQIHHNKN